MRIGTLLVLLLACGCSGTRKQLERAATYEKEGMYNEAYAIYEELHDRRPKEVDAHIGMKRAAQARLDRILAESSGRYLARDMAAGDQERSRAILFKQEMDRKGLALQWDGSVDVRRDEAGEEVASTLHRQAENAFEAEHFEEAERLTTEALTLRPGRKETVRLNLLAQLEPRYRRAMAAREQGDMRTAYQDLAWIDERDNRYKDVALLLPEAREKGSFTLAIVPLLNVSLYTVKLGGTPGQVEQQLVAQIKQALLGLGDASMILVDRDQTDRFLEEQQRTMSGVFDDNYVVEAGKLLGAEHVLTTRILRFDDVLARLMEVQLQVLDAETGRIEVAEIINVGKQEIVGTNARAQLLKKAADRIAERMAKFDPRSR